MPTGAGGGRSIMSLMLKAQTRSVFFLALIILVVTFTAIVVGYLNSRKSSEALWQQMAVYQQEVAQKNLLVSQIQSLLGYGGIIHNFKNYVLRRNPAMVGQIEDQIVQLHQKVLQYQQLPVIESELQALTDLVETVDTYQQMLRLAVSLNEAGVDTSELDRQVKVSDVAAVQAITKLNQYLETNSEAQAQTLVALNEKLQRTELQYLLLILFSLAFCWLLLISSYQRNLKKALIPIRNSIADILADDLPTEYRTPITGGSLDVIVTQINQLVARGQGIARIFVHNQHQLRKSEFFQRTIFESVPNGIVIIDRNGSISTANRSAEILLKRPESELKATSFFVFLTSDNVFKLRNELLLNKAQQEPGTQAQRLDIDIVDAEGFLVPVRLELHPIEVDNDYQLIVSIYDLSEQRREEEKLRTLIAQADQANKMKTHFLASVSHELRTPLNSILGFTQLLLEQDNAGLSERQLDSLNEVKHGGEHLRNLVNDVLDLAQIEAGVLNFNAEPLTLSSVLDEVLNFTRTLCADAGIELQRPASIPDVRFQCDRVRLRQVLINLLSNAVKYNREQGLIDVSTEIQRERWLRISIRDTGIGIAPEKHHRVFREFDRLGVQKSSVEGVGIGLALTRKLVEGMGGRIDFVSVAGTGSTFWVEFPLLAEVNRSTPASDSADLFRLFVVTTSDELQLAADGALAEHDDIRVMQFPMMSTALLRAMITPPDLLIVDYASATPSDYELAQWLDESQLNGCRLILIGDEVSATWHGRDRVQIISAKQAAESHFAHLKREINQESDSKIFRG